MLLQRTLFFRGKLQGIPVLSEDLLVSTADDSFDLAVRRRIGPRLVKNLYLVEVVHQRCISISLWPAIEARGYFIGFLKKLDDTLMLPPVLTFSHNTLRPRSLVVPT